MQVDVAVVILNYNGKDFLKSFLPHLQQFTSDYRLIIADNASTDDSVAYLQNEFPDIELIELKENFGFAGGYNKALEQVEASYYILLNSDVEVTPDWASHLISFLESNEAYAACQPKVKAFHSKNHFEYAGAAGGFLDSLGYAYCRGRLFDVLEEDKDQYNTITDVDWATGACLAIRSDVYHQLNGLDSDFFAHMEEIDLCWRIRNAGWRIACVPESEVYHVGGGTLNQTNPRKTYLNFRNNLLLLAKNLSPQQLLWKLPIRMSLDFLAAFQFWKSHSFAHFKAVFQAEKDFLLSLPNTVRKRKENKTLIKRRVKLSPKLLIWSFYIRGVRKFSDLPATSQH